MATLTETAAIARGTQGLFRLLSPEQIEQILHLERDEALEMRIGQLAERANEGELSENEEAEYRGYVEANSVLALLRAAARRQQSLP